MNIKINSAELNRMMRIIGQCIDPRFSGYSNIEVAYDKNALTIRGTNGSFQGTVSTPLLGGDGESFCIDGNMFAKVCAMCSGEIEIRTDGKFCTVKGAGRTRIPIVDASIAEQTRVSGKSAEIGADELAKCYAGVSHAVATDQSRIQLTGVLTEVSSSGMRMVALDGFQMSMETAKCNGDDMKVIIPGSFLSLLTKGIYSGEKVTLRTDGNRIEASTDGIVLTCGLLTGEYPDYNRILPTEFGTECLIDVEKMRYVLKSGSVVNSKQNLVKLEIGADSIKVMNNSEEADYEAEVPCLTNGNTLKIAFNLKYLIGTMNAVSTEKAVMKFNSSVSPCVVNGKDEDGIRLLLPVRVMG